MYNTVHKWQFYEWIELFFDSYDSIYTYINIYWEADTLNIIKYVIYNLKICERNRTE